MGLGGARVSGSMADELALVAIAVAAVSYLTFWNREEAEPAASYRGLQHVHVYNADVNGDGRADLTLQDVFGQKSYVLIRGEDGKLRETEQGDSLDMVLGGVLALGER